MTGDLHLSVVQLLVASVILIISQTFHFLLSKSFGLTLRNIKNIIFLLDKTPSAFLNPSRSPPLLLALGGDGDILTGISIPPPQRWKKHTFQITTRCRLQPQVQPEKRGLLAASAVSSPEETCRITRLFSRMCIKWIKNKFFGGFCLVWNKLRNNSKF